MSICCASEIKSVSFAYEVGSIDYEPV
jgi:hypothetical protein